jgi:hypothetical protein
MTPRVWDRADERSQENRLVTRTSRRPQFASPPGYVIITDTYVHVTTIPERWA